MTYIIEHPYFAIFQVLFVIAITVGPLALGGCGNNPQQEIQDLQQQLRQEQLTNLEQSTNLELVTTERDQAVARQEELQDYLDHCGVAYIKKSAIEDVSSLECVYIAVWNVPGFLGPYGPGNGVKYDAGIFPVFGEFKTVMGDTMLAVLRDSSGNDEFTEEVYQLLFLPANGVSSNWRDTAWGMDFGGYDVTPHVDGACLGYSVPQPTE